MTYNAAISACEKCGQWRWALALLSEIGDRGIREDRQPTRADGARARGLAGGRVGVRTGGRVGGRAGASYTRMEVCRYCTYVHVNIIRGLVSSSPTLLPRMTMVVVAAAAAAAAAWARARAEAWALAGARASAGAGS